MTKTTIPTYAIVELLIRLAHSSPFIGDYKGHVIYNDGVIVKTTHGSIVFSKLLIKQQFEAPEMITLEELNKLAETFKNGK